MLKKLNDSVKIYKITQTKFPAAPASGVASASEMSAGATPRSGGMRASEPPGCPQRRRSPGLDSQDNQD